MRKYYKIIQAFKIAETTKSKKRKDSDLDLQQGQSS